MATPLFIASRATLLSQLRLSSAPTGTDVDAIVDKAILAARTKFYRTLTASRVSVLVAIPFVENASTDDGILRAVANLTEQAIVRLFLLRELPTMFLDTAGSLDEAWNEAPVHSGLSETEREIRRLEDEIAENLELLSGDESLGNETHIHVSSVGPDTTPPRPGDSIFSRSGRQIAPLEDWEDRYPL